MARRGRPVGAMWPLKKAASNYKRKSTMAKTTALYELMWGEKPKRGRPKKEN